MRERIATAILIVLACTATSRGQMTPRAPKLRTTYFNSARFMLPVEHPQGNPVRVELLVSRDEGRSWSRMDAIHYNNRRPSANQFTVQAPDDGNYWFSVRTLFPTHADPQGPPQAEVKVVVDTRQPELTLRVLAGGSGELVAQWEIADTHLDPDSLKIEYQTTQGGPWKSIPVKPPGNPQATRLSGESVWWPRSAAEGVTVRAEVMDSARNRRQAQQWHPLSKIAAKPTEIAGKEPPALTGDPSSIRWPAGGRPQTPPHTISNGVESIAARPTSNAPPETSTANPPTPDSESTAQANEQPRTGGWTSRDPSKVATRSRPGPVHPPVAYQNSRVTPISRTLLKQLPEGDQPSMTNSKRFEFDYDVDAVGRDGIARIELYRTQDAGRSWTLDQKIDSPDPDRPLQVSVKDEGIYGYRVVVVARNGFASRRPAPGDQADMWVGVDVTAPEVRLTGAVYGRDANAGKLAIRWQAHDAMLGQRPISIRFSESPDGPWSTIASGLPNTGEYFWAAGPRTPEQIYLRLEIRDAAGNSSADQLERPIRIEGLIPRGRIRGFRPVD